MSGIKDKVVVITGASSGIGEAIAERLSKDGAKLMLGARREDRLKSLAEKLGGDAAYHVTDVTRRDDVRALAKAAIDKFGHIDVLINNAGVMPLSFLSEGKVDEWDKMIDVNIKGVLYGVDAVLGHMLERESGQVINIASTAGHRVVKSGVVYCGTKHAVRAISEGLRMETAGKIRSTIISPGAVETELGNDISNDQIKDRVKTMQKDTGLKPEDIAEAAAYAISQPDSVSVNEVLIRPTVQEG